METEELTMKQDASDEFRSSSGQDGLFKGDFYSLKMNEESPTKSKYFDSEKENCNTQNKKDGGESIDKLETEVNSHSYDIQESWIEETEE
jgi:hypothetical protein